MIRILGFILCLMGTAAVADPPEGYPFLPFDKAMEQANAETKLMFVYFGRYGCGYCDKTNKEAFSDPGVKVRILLNVNADSGDREHLDSLCIGFS